MMHQKEFKKIDLKGLTLAPSQNLGNVRLVPLLKKKVQGDLRMNLESYDEPLSIVELTDKTEYISYIPHGLIVNWDDTGNPICSVETNLAKNSEKQVIRNNVRVMQRMVKCTDKKQLRLLPLHISMEYYLAQYFLGPHIIWDEYSRYTQKYGLGVRSEWTWPGHALNDLKKALRVFEIYEAQVGVLLFIADAFTSAFIVSHPEDYRKLHHSLVEDFYSDIIMHYNLIYQTVPEMRCRLDDSKVNSISDLRNALRDSQKEWNDFQAFMADNLLNRNLHSERIYGMGPFQLFRFLTELNESDENHIGECICRSDGSIEYLKTYRLGKDQAARLKLLRTLDDHDWEIGQTAKSLNQTKDALVRYIDKLGFGYILKPNIVKKGIYRKRN